MSRSYVTIAATVLLLSGLLACSKGSDTPAGGGPLTLQQTRYLSTANLILADANAAFGPIRGLETGTETPSASEVESSTARLEALKKQAAALEPPARFSEEHALLTTALEKMVQAAEMAMTSMEKGDEDSRGAARARAKEAFDLLRKASAAFLAESRR